MLKRWRLGRPIEKGQKEIEAGVTEGDVLNKYIRKQHQAEIEAEKWYKDFGQRRIIKAEELAASETVAEAVEAPEVTETVLEQDLKWMLSQQSYQLKIKFGPTNRTNCREQRTFWNTKQCG